MKEKGREERVVGWGAPVLIFHLLKQIQLRGEPFLLIPFALNVFIFFRGRLFLRRKAFYMDIPSFCGKVQIKLHFFRGVHLA